MRDYYLCYPAILTNTLVPQPGLSSILQNQLGVALDALTDTYDETTSMLDTTVPLGEFLDEQLARARENEIIETVNIDESDDEDSPPRYELPVVPEGYVMDEETARDFLACNDRSDLKKLLAKMKEKSLNARMI